MKMIHEYYKCNYCDYQDDDYREFKYTDNSGLCGKCFDMCCDDCFKKHLIFLKNNVFKDPKKYNMDLKRVTIEDYIKYHIRMYGKGYGNKTEEIFNELIKWVIEYWETIK